MATKSAEATIDYLLTCLEATEGKTNWEEVATKTGWYKSGKQSLQAFRNIEKKYKGTVVGNEDDQAAATPKKKGKRTVAGDDNDQATPTPKKAKLKEEEGDNDVN